MNDLWPQLAARASREISALQLAQLNAYLDLLFEANQTMNLTRIVDRASAEVQHVGDALTVLPHLPAGEHRLADVGTGGGVPGIPLAIVRPDADVSLIESTKKKAAFLRNTVEALELANVTVLDARVEDVGQQSRQRESFDIVIARAVATMEWLAEWCLPLTKVGAGAKMLAMKGPKVVDELPAAMRVIHRAGGAEPIVHPVDLPGTAGHVIVEIAKLRSSNKQLPRSPTVAKGRSLA